MSENHNKGFPGKIRILPENTAAILEKSYKLPKDTKMINPALLFNKLIWMYSSEYEIPKKEKIKFYSHFEHMNMTYPLTIFRNKMQYLGWQMETQYGSQNIKTFSLALHPQSRLIVGIGNPSPAETGILLHHIYGVPYIPGSALKGITRQAAVVEIAQNIREEKGFEDERIYHCFGFVDAVIEAEYSEGALKKIRNQQSEAERADIKREDLKVFMQTTAEKKKIKAKNEKKRFTEYEKFIPKNDSIKNQIILTREIFGSQSTRGSILFLDAYPEPGIRFKADIMNPHYPNYYNNASEPPGDWQNPLPIPFLTVEKGTFHFTLLKIKQPVGKEGENPDTLNKTEEWLKTALKDFGVGAKTALGYGMFRENLSPQGERS
jgi:CRISPR-associated protein Cmr6